MHDIVISNQACERGRAKKKSFEYSTKPHKGDFCRRLVRPHQPMNFVSQDIITCDQQSSVSENEKSLKSESADEATTLSRARSCVVWKKIKIFQRSNFQHSTSSTFISLARLWIQLRRMCVWKNDNNAMKKTKKKAIENSLEKWNVFFCTPGENILLWIFLFLESLLLLRSFGGDNFVSSLCFLLMSRGFLVLFYCCSTATPTTTNHFSLSSLFSISLGSFHSSTFRRWLILAAVWLCPK